MQNKNKMQSKIPVLPAALCLPFKRLPTFVHNKVLITTLNKIFSEELKSGELDFLQNKVIHILIKDAEVNYFFSLNNNKFIAANEKASPNLFLQGTVYNYLLLASRQEDTDSLFFSRRLQMQGNTELGLYVKNFLDGMDMNTHKASAHLEFFLQKILPMYKRIFS